MKRCSLCLWLFAAMLVVVPVAARSQTTRKAGSVSGSGKGAETPPPDAPKAAGPEAELRKGAAADTRPTPAGGFALDRRRMGVRLEIGFPFVIFQLSYGTGAGFELFAGYNGFYALAPGAFGGFKIQLVTNTARTVGLSLKALGGWTYLRKDWDDMTMFTAGSGGFGEVWLMFTGRRGRHGMFVNGGVRVSQVQACKDGDRDECMDHLLEGKKGVGVLVFAELGYEVRLMRHASFFVAGGANLYPNSSQLPGLVRFRTGMIMDF